MKTTFRTFWVVHRAISRIWFPVFLVVTLITFASSSALAVSISIGWANALDSSSNVLSPSNAIGTPDGSHAGFFGGSPASAVFSDFSNGISTSTNSNSFAALLGITETTLSQADFITFERNGTPGGPYESASWVFEETFPLGGMSIPINFDRDNPMVGGGIVGYGNISNSSYANFFGFANPFSSGDMAFLLFDLGGLNPTSVSIVAQGGGSSSPDLDVLGFITTVPEPTTVLLAIVGLLAFTLPRRRKLCR